MEMQVLIVEDGSPLIRPTVDGTLRASTGDGTPLASIVDGTPRVSAVDVDGIPLATVDGTRP